MELIKFLIDLFLHLDKYLSQIIAQYGAWTYALLTLVIFMETGFVVTPFLPGDSLLFAAGTFAAIPESNLNVYLLFILLTLAAIIGDTVNYWLGYKIGARAFSGEVKWIKKEYMEKTHAFFDAAHREPLAAFFRQGARAIHSAMSVGVGLDHGAHRRIRGDEIADGGEVVLQRHDRDLAPGRPGGHIRAGFQPLKEGTFRRLYRMELDHPSAPMERAGALG